VIGELFNTVLLRPFLNALLFLYHILGNNYALAIVVLTVVLRGATQPLMAKQLQSSKRMQELQPQLKELEKKHSGDKEKLAQAQMALYKENGISPLGGCLPTLLQFPIWIALYQSIIQTLGHSPMQLLALSKHIYSFGIFSSLQLLIPLSSHFLWLDLGRPDPIYILPILTGVLMWVQQKMMTPAPQPGQAADSTQQAQSQTMNIMMPAMFVFITWNLASGLALYFVISNIVGIVAQYFVTGWGSLGTLLPFVAKAGQPSAASEKGTKSGSRKKKR
jgi:YidC/Oxa1 family membrane protein insertase